MPRAAKKIPGVVILSAILSSGLIVLFQNCSAPYELVNSPSAMDKSSKPALRINDGASFTNSPLVQLALANSAEIPKSISITSSRECDPQSAWQVYEGAAAHTLPGDSDGQKTVSVKFLTDKGTETECLSASIVLDRSAPKLELVVSPPAFTGNPIASFQLSGSDTLSGLKAPRGFLCRLNSGNFESCDMNVVYRELATGLHAFEAKAVDQAGNESSVVRHAWTFNPQLPQVSTIKRVCKSGCPFTLPSQALAASVAGDTIEIEPGVYEDCLVITLDGITVKGLVGRPKLTGKVCEDKGVIVTKAKNTTIAGLEIANATNGNHHAGILHSQSAANLDP